MGSPDLRTQKDGGSADSFCFILVVCGFCQDGAGEGGGVSDATEFESEKENAKDFALWKVRLAFQTDYFYRCDESFLNRAASAC